MSSDNNASREVVVFGARSGAGLEVVRLARASGWSVTAVIRPGADPGEVADLGCTVVEVDALDVAGVNGVMAGVRPGPVVVSTLGSRGEGLPVDHLGNVAVIDAAAKAGAERMVLVTSLGCGDSRAFASERLLAAIGPVLDAKTMAEDHLRASGLAYTIIRPGGLISDPPTGGGVLYDDPRLHGRIARPDLATLVVACVTGANTVGRTLSAIDRTKRLDNFDIPEFSV